MDSLAEWLSEHPLPLGSFIADGVDLLNTHAQGGFDAVSDTLGDAVEGATDALLAVPAIGLIAVIALLAWLIQKRMGLVVFAVLSLLLIVNLGLWSLPLQPPFD